MQAIQPRERAQGDVRQRPRAPPDGDRAPVQGGQPTPSRGASPPSPPSPCSSACTARYPTPPPRGSSPTASTDPSLGGPRHRVQERRHRLRVARTSPPRPAPGLARHHRVPRPPVLLVVSQSARRDPTPETQSTDPSQQQTQAIPVSAAMIGFFSPPRGATLYWFANNISAPRRRSTCARPPRRSRAGGAARAGAVPGTPGGAARRRSPCEWSTCPSRTKRSRARRPRPNPRRRGGAHAGLARGEFADFDDGPAKVTEVVEATVVGEAAGPAERGTAKRGIKRSRPRGAARGRTRRDGVRGTPTNIRRGGGRPAAGGSSDAPRGEAAAL